MMTRLLFLAPLLLLVSGCNKGLSLTGASIEILEPSTLPVTITSTSITMPVGQVVYVRVHPKRPDRDFGDAISLVPDDPAILAYEVLTGVGSGYTLQTTDDTQPDTLETDYLLYGPTAGKTTLRIRPSQYSTDIRHDTGEVRFSVTITDQP